MAIIPQEQNDARYFVEHLGKEVLWGTQIVADFESAYQKYSQGNYQGAVKGFLRITKTTPQWTEAHYWLGRSYLELGRYQAARTRLNRVVQGTNVDSEIYAGASWLLTTF